MSLSLALVRDIAQGPAAMERLPSFLKKRLPLGAGTRRTRSLIRDLGLETICDEARCPNRVECHAHGTATFLIMGEICTRRCAFCSVKTGRPRPLDSTEPGRVAEAVDRLGLRHVVVTSVDRDDLPDGGAAHFAAVIEAIHARCADTAVEVLTPDFRGDPHGVEMVMAAAPEIFSHNVETVPRLYPAVRHRGNFEVSLQVLRHARALRPDRPTKTGLMVGLGERPDEVESTMRAIRGAGVELLTIGQYLRPTREQVAVAAYIDPGQYEIWEAQGRAMGFRAVFAGPFVRSSYLADQMALAS